MNRVVAIAGWAGIVLLSLWLLRDTGAPPTGEGELVYLASPIGAEPTRFDVAGAPRARLTLWLDTPRRWANDPRATRAALVVSEAVDSTGTLLTRDSRWVTFRSGWALDSDPALIPTERGPDASRELLGNRHVVVELPATSHELRVRVEHVPDGDRLLVVAHTEVQRGAFDRLRGQVGADADRKARYADRVGPFPWEEVPDAFRAGVLDHDWNRRAPIDVDTEPIRISSRSDRPAYDAAAAPAVAMAPGAAAAFNLEGPQRLEAHWTAPDGTTPRRVHTRIRILGEGLPEDRDLGLVERVGPLDFDEGTRAVFVARAPDDAGPAPLLRTTTAGPGRDRSWGTPPRLELVDGTQRLAPDFIVLTAFRTRPDDALRFEIPARHEVRILARPRLAPGPLPGLDQGLEETGAWLEIDDGDRTARRYVPGRPSSFERFIQGDDPASARVSEETEWFLPSREGPWVLRLAGDAIDIAVFVKEERAPSDVPQPGYPLEALGDTIRARYLPYARRTWRARYPEELDRLGTEDRVVRMDAQVRWALVGSRRAPGDEYQVLELAPPFELVAYRDPSGSRSRLGKRPLQLEIPETGRLLVDYRVPIGAVGSRIGFSLGDEAHEVPVRAAGGTFRFEGLEPGPLAASTSADGVFLANASGPNRWRIRRVWGLAAGQRRSIPIPADARGISVHVARRSGEPAGELRWALRAPRGGELPVTAARREGRVALGTPAGEVAVLSRAEGRWVWAPGLALRLQRRLEGQPAVLDVWLDQRDEPVWIWVSSTWAKRRDAFERHWSLTGVPDR